MNGQATYDRGSVSVRNVTLAAGQLNAGASADIAENGALSGRVVALTPEGRSEPPRRVQRGPEAS